MKLNREKWGQWMQMHGWLQNITTTKSQLWRKKAILKLHCYWPGFNIYCILLTSLATTRFLKKYRDLTFYKNDTHIIRADSMIFGVIGKSVAWGRHISLRQLQVRYFKSDQTKAHHCFIYAYISFPNKILQAPIHTTDGILWHCKKWNSFFW